MRLDKYLKVSRIIKRRTVANEACDSGRVMLNDKVARASAEVKAGDVIEIAFGNKSVSHKLTLQNRGSVMLTGVKDVVAFDENQVVLDTELGLLTIKGKNLHMNRLTLEKGEADLEGQIDSLAYSSNESLHKSGESLFNRLFR